MYGVVECLCAVQTVANGPLIYDVHVIMSREIFLSCTVPNRQVETENGVTGNTILELQIRTLILRKVLQNGVLGGLGGE